MFVEADVEECVRVTGKNPIGERWVDVDKGFRSLQEQASGEGLQAKVRGGCRGGTVRSDAPI